MAVDGTLEEPGEGRHISPRASLRQGVMQAGPLALAGLLANGGSLIVTIVLARILVSRDYGALNQLLGVFFVVATPGSALLVAVVRHVASWTEGRGALAGWATALHRRSAWALGGCAVVLASAGPALAALLGRNDPAGLDAIALAGAVWVTLCIDRGILQARREYRALSWNLLCEGALRTTCMVVAGVAGLGVTGVAAGVLLAEIGTAAQARMVAMRPWRGSVARPWRRAQSVLSGRDVVAAVLSLAAIALLQNVDVLVIGREGPRQAGAYAAVSVSSKVLVFLALVVGGYLLPEAAHAWRAGRSAFRQLWLAIVLVEAPGVVLACVAAVAPRRFLAMFFSARYVTAADAFLPLACAMAFLSLVVLLTMYLLAIGDRRVAGLLVAAGAAATVAVAFAHGSPRGTAWADLTVQGALCAIALGELVLVHRGGRACASAVGLVVPTAPTAPAAATAAMARATQADPSVPATPAALMPSAFAAPTKVPTISPTTPPPPGGPSSPGGFDAGSL